MNAVQLAAGATAGATLDLATGGTMKEMLEPTDGRYQRLLNGINEVKRILDAKTLTLGALNTAAEIAQETWVRNWPGLLEASRQGENTERWCERFEELRVLTSRAALAKANL